MHEQSCCPTADGTCTLHTFSRHCNPLNKFDFVCVCYRGPCVRVAKCALCRTCRRNTQTRPICCSACEDWNRAAASTRCFGTFIRFLFLLFSRLSVSSLDSSHLVFIFIEIYLRAKWSILFIVWFDAVDVLLFLLLSAGDGVWNSAFVYISSFVRGPSAEYSLCFVSAHTNDLIEFK